MAGALTSRPAVPFWAVEAAPARRSFAPTLALAVVAVLTVAAALARLTHVDFQSLWLDEGYTLLFSGLPLPRLITVGGAHEHPPLYYLLVHLLLSVHHSYLVPRLISVLAGTASIPVLYALGARLFDRGVGVAAALFLAVSPFHLWFDDDGRAYALAGLLVLLSYLFLCLLLDRPGPILLLAYAAALAACLYTEYTTALVLLPQGILLWRAAQRGSVRVVVLSWGIALLVFAPWLPRWLQNASAVSRDYWIPRPTWASLQTVLLEALGVHTTCPRVPCTGTLAPLPGLTGHEVVVAGALAALMAGVLIWAVVRRDVSLLVAALWFVLPFALILLLSLRRSLFLDRVFLDATYGLYLVLGWWLANALRRPALLLLAVPLVPVVIGALLASHATYVTVTNEDWKSALRDAGAAYRPGQAVVYYPAPMQPIAAAYLPSTWRPAHAVSLWFHQYLDVPGRQGRYGRFSDEALVDLELAGAARGQRAVWLLAEDYAYLPVARHWFGAHGFQLRLSQLYDGGARIELWDRAPARAFGPPVVGGRFGPGWRASGAVTARAGTAAVSGRTQLLHDFRVRPGHAYVVDLTYRCLPPAYPLVSVETAAAAGHTSRAADPFGTAATVFPRTRWYDWPVTGVWLSQPFGFIVPPGNTRAILRLRTLWGVCAWRNVAVYRER